MRVVSEGPVRITRASVDAAWRRRASGVRLVVRDATVRGLALVVNATGMAWTFSYKPRGMDPRTGRRFPSRGVTLGTPEGLSPDEARADAGRLKSAVKAGRDPARDRREAIAAAAAARAQTLGRLLDIYAVALPARPRLRASGGPPSAGYVHDELAHTRAALATMDALGLPAGALGVPHVRTLLAAEAARPPTRRARWAALNRFLDWCHDQGHLPANPCTLVAKVHRPRPPAARQHAPTPADLARLWHTAGALHPTARDLARFLMAVPCWRGEAARMEWPQLDLAAGVWTQPGAITKNGDAHRLRLHPLALAILRERHAAAGEPTAGLVFPAPRSGEAMRTFSRVKAAIVARGGSGDWRWHDFRRSFATALGEAGVAEPVVDAVLNHRQAATRGGVLGVYQRASRWPEQRRAMEMWGEFLAAALDGRQTETVVALRRPA
jgi:integrase